MDPIPKVRDIIVICPHCNNSILIEQLNCRVFRHGILISNGQQINPHETKDVCDYFVSSNMIYGCGKPFRIVTSEQGEHSAIMCEYI